MNNKNLSYFNTFGNCTDEMNYLSSKSMRSDFGKCVKFENHVEIFKINESGEIQVQKCQLETEEVQAKRRLKERNF